MSDSAASGLSPSPDPADLLKSRAYVAMLVMAAMVGVLVSTVAYFYLKAVASTQTAVFTTLPKDLGWSAEPVWWPLLPLFVSGLIVAISIRFLPGTSGHKPAEGLKASGTIRPVDLYGIVLASFATLALGAVLGPEAPLIAVGGGLGALAVRLLKRDAPARAVAAIGAAGAFAAISTLLGSPVVGAFLIMETAGLGGPMLGVVLVPGLLAAGVGALIFVGLDDWTGYGTFTLSIPGAPAFTTPTGYELLWALVIGVAAALVGTVVHRTSRVLQPHLERRMIILTPLAGLAVAGCAIAFAESTGRDSSEVLFSGQLDGRRAGAGGAVQVGGLRHLAQLLPRRPGLPQPVHRSRGRDRPLPSARPADGRRGGHGHRCHGRGDARPADDLRTAARPAVPVRCPGAHPVGDLGCRRLLRDQRENRSDGGTRCA
jgi:H+/Cl- antiporter ClcA